MPLARCLAAAIHYAREGYPVTDRLARWIAETAPELRQDAGSAALFLGGGTVGEEGLLAAGRLAAGTGARLMTETFPPRAVRGAGLPDVLRLPYPPEMAIAALAGTKHLVLAGAEAPVHFFAYPGVPGTPVP